MSFGQRRLMPQLLVFPSRMEMLEDLPAEARISMGTVSASSSTEVSAQKSCRLQHETSHASQSRALEDGDAKPRESMLHTQQSQNVKGVKWKALSLALSKPFKGGGWVKGSGWRVVVEHFSKPPYAQMQNIFSWKADMQNLGRRELHN